MGYKFSGRNSKGFKWLESHEGMIAYQKGSSYRILENPQHCKYFVALNETGSKHYNKVNVLINKLISSSLDCNIKTLENLYTRKETAVSGNDLRPWRIHLR